MEKQKLSPPTGIDDWWNKDVNTVTWNKNKETTKFTYQEEKEILKHFYENGFC